MEIHQSAVILLLVLSVSFSTHAQSEAYNTFLRQHVFGNMNVQKCDSEIRKRDIIRAQTDNGCKEINTFIQADKKLIRTVCGEGGKPKGGNLFMSTKPFPVITCKLQSGERHPNCEYRGSSSTRNIVLACEQGWPVHYQEGRVNVG